MQRFLNKVIFINSASVKYAEIELNGNVHLIGTQGVGKSTLLRAILFFYIADKTKLGISREKIGFDSYYFPNSNSYLVFEVERDGFYFCVLAFQSQGKTAFRFFNSAYDKNLFIDKEGNVAENWTKIREKLGSHIYHTSIISSYEEYKNIIYGNNAGLKAEFRKYAILESNKFQNIPRSIQNIFLNSKLDAQFIKETIIKSIDENNTKIDIGLHGSHLNDFETHYEDIKKWQKKDNEGKILLVSQAQTIENECFSLLKSGQEIKDSAKKLVWAVEDLKTQEPILLQKQSELEIELKEIEKKFDSEKVIFSTKRKNIDGQIAVIEEDLKKITTKKNDYKTKNIELLITKSKEESKWKNKQQELVDEQGILTAKFAEIETKYKARIDNLQNSLNNFVNSQKEKENNLNANFYFFKDKTSENYTSIINQINEQYKNQVEKINTSIEAGKEKITNLEKQEIEVKYKQFLELEIKEKKEEISKFSEENKQAENQNKEYEGTLKNLKEKIELEKEKINLKSETEIEKQKELKVKINDKIEGIETKLKNNEGSLYDWLSINNPNWTFTIGKIIDEDVLFRKDLSPKLINYSENALSPTNLYGIEIDLNEIEKTTKTIQDYQNEIQEFKNKYNEIEKAILSIQATEKEQLENLNKNYIPKLRELKKIIDENKYKIDKNELQTKKTNQELIELNKKAELEKRTKLEFITLQINQQKSEQTQLLENKKNKLEEQKQEVDSQNKTKNSEIDSKNNEVKEEINRLSIQSEHKKQETKNRIEEINEQKNSELNNEEANTFRIIEIEKELNTVKSELDFIDQNRQLVFEFQKDKRELFDNENLFLDSKINLEKELSSQKQEFDNKETIYKRLKSENTEENAIITQKKQDLDKNKEEYERFKKETLYEEIVHFFIDSDSNDKTKDSVCDLINQIKNNYYSKIKQTTEFKKSITKFAGDFNDRNVFKFSTQFFDDEDYFQFADKLKEFVEENKIVEFETRVNERFAHIILQIGKEINQLMAKEGDIKKVVTQINQDFLSKNFVGAIKSIELRIVESNNKLIKTLTEIKEFSEENSVGIGKTDLFSSASTEVKNEKAIKLLNKFIKQKAEHNMSELTLSDSFGLQFRVEENGNNSGWVESLSNFGSEGTDVLIKAMVNIMLLNVFKEGASRKFKDFKLHCMMDEIGRLHPNNIEGILKFANDRNILLINGSPTSQNAMDYKYTYILSKDNKNTTRVKRLIKKID